jgi:hypothetical protein
LISKLEVRDTEAFRRLAASKEPLSHPLFSIIPGEAAVWERIPGVQSARARKEDADG